MTDAFTRHKAHMRALRQRWTRELYSPDPATRDSARWMLDYTKGYSK